MTKHFRGFLALLSAAIIFSTFGVLIRELDKMFGDFTQTAVRLAVAFVMVIAMLAVKKGSLHIHKSNWLKTALFSVTFPLAVVFFTFSVNNTKAANTVFMFYVANLLFSLVIGTLIFKEKLGIFRIVALFIVILGLAIFINPFTVSTISIGLIYGLVSGIFDAISNSLRKSLRNLSRGTLLFYQYGTGAFIGLFFALLAVEDMIREFRWQSVLVGLIYGVGLVLIGNLLLFGFSHFDVNIGTIVLATELFFAIIVSYLFLHESPTPNELAGGVLIFFAAVITNVDIKSLRKLFLRK